MRRRSSSPLRLRSALVIWVLVALTPMQALAAALLAARGPLHTHIGWSSSVVLEDVRRASTHATLAPPRHVATWLGHFHAGAPQRHPHRIDDASVQTVGDLGAATSASGDDASGARLAAAIAVLPDVVVWLVRAPGPVHAARAAWSPRTHDPEPLDRPPRTT